MKWLVNPPRLGIYLYDNRIDMKTTLEESQRQAEILKRIQKAFMELDVEYLEVAYKEMKDNLSFRSSAMILNPNPMTAMESNDLEAVKLKQLRLYLDAAKNQSEIIKAEEVLSKARVNQNKLWNLFR